MPMNDWSALTPALSPRRGSALRPILVRKLLAAPARATNAATRISTTGVVAALPLLGVRAGVSSKQLGQRIIVQRFALAHAARFKL
jgi:hypothetical protein